MRTKEITKKIEKIYSLTPLQEGMLFHHLEDSESTEYVIQNILKVTGQINESAMHEGLHCLEKRHAALRTSIVYERLSKSRQVVLLEKPIEFSFIDLSSIEADKQQKEFEKIVKQDLYKKYNLTTDSLIRLTHAKYDEYNHKLIWNFHHIIIDGWCMPIIFGDFFKYYHWISKGKSKHEILEEVEKEKREGGKYSEYIQWLETRDQEEGLSYWKKLLEGYNEVAKIDSVETKDKTKEQMKRLKRNLGKEKSQKLAKRAKDNQVTINTVAEVAWGIVLQKYNNNNDVVFGKVVSGRNADVEGIEEIVGMFINTIPVRVKSSDETTVKELWKELQNQSNEGINYHYCSLAEIQAESGQGGDLIQTLFVFENYYVDEKRLNDGVKDLSVQLESGREQTNYALNISMYYSEEELQVDITYNPNKYGEQEMIRLLEKIDQVLTLFGEDEEIKIKNIEIISEAEKEKVLLEFNHITSEYLKDMTIVTLFEEQVAKTPDKTALVYEGKKLSYSELNEKVNQLAHILRKKGVGRNTFVGILSERSLEMIIGIYGIIKAGGAYVPMDPKHPTERIQYMIEDFNPKIILTYQTRIETEREILDLGDSEIYENVSKENLTKVNQQEDLLYVIYTSGTMGKPKGVMVEHRGIVNLIKNFTIPIYESYNVQTILFTASYVFDASVESIFGTLLHGVTMHIADYNLRLNENKMHEYICNNDIDLINVTPTHFKMLTMIEFKNTPLKVVILGGEKLEMDLVEKYKNCFVIYNVYGPTECSVNTTSYRCNERNQYIKSIPIGKPLTNSQVYILQENSLCGIGMAGELCIAGDGLARGYLNQEEMTKEKFVKNPYGKGKLYRSGDLARWLEDGNIEYLGRIDEQVKIRGFRIELGEIEGVLRKQPNIKDAVVIVREDKTGDKALYGYVVANEVVEISLLREGLSKELPEYMVPRYLMKIEKIPITINGKVDKKNLPEIDTRSQNEYVAPRGETERILSEIFKEILGIEKVSVRDSFFSLGGHSLRAIRLVNRIEAEIGVRVELGKVFSNATVEQLSKLIEGKDGDYKRIPKARQKETYEMSSSQKRIYLIQQMDKSSIVYNMPYAIKLKGEVDTKRLKDSLNALVKRHEILRTDFIMEEGELWQKIRKDVEAEFTCIEDEKTSETLLLEEFTRPFELSKSPLVRMKLVKQKENSLLLCDMHHIISDGMSMGTFLQEFSQLYNGEELPKLTHQYKDYSEWMRGKDLSAQKEYWKEVYADEIPILDMPLDYPRPSEQSFHGGVKIGIIEEDIAKQIKELAKGTGSTEYMVFLSTAMVLLGRYSRQEDIIIGSPVSGRIHKDTEGMLGMFVNTLAMRGRPEREKSYEDLLKEVREGSLKAYENQEYPYEELIEEIGVVRDMSRNPLFDVMLVMQNNEQIHCELSGIKSESVQIEHKISKFDLTFNIEEFEKGYVILLGYCSDLYKESSAKRILDAYIEVLKQVSKDKSILIKEIAIISEAEKERVLHEFNDTAREYPKNKTIVELFEEQVAKTPDKTAVVYEEKKLSYRELNEKANQLAHVLRKKGVGRDTFVGILSERSLEMIIGIYGIIKAGGAYVPMDPAYPAERIRYMIEDCNPKVILTCQAKIETKRETLDLCDQEIYRNISKENPIKVNQSGDLLYVIYTSGTTGKPKGVMIEHKGIVNRIVWMQKMYPLDSCDAILQKTTYTFDVSVWEIFWGLFVGAKLIILEPGGEKDPQSIYNTIKKYDVTTIHFVPSMLNLFLQWLRDESKSTLYKLRYIFASGEALRVNTICEFNKIIKVKNKETRLINLYGPTEASIDVTYFNCNDDYNVFIGRPISNTQIYIMREDELCGIGIPGELCIAGDGVARGYLNQPELTAEKFVRNPFKQGQMYRSGDLARWMPDGNIEYLGRIDEQVKVRGFRIELGEIESVLRKQSGIRDAAVIVREDKIGDKILHGYVVAEENVKINVLREGLSNELPEYMVPSYLMQIEKIPVTANGKLDKKNLPEVEVKTGNKYVVPKNETEKALSKIFKEILGVDKISTKDSFFVLGGDSIKAIRVVSKMREAGYDVEVKDIMNGRTIEVISKRTKRSEALSYNQEEVSGEVKTTPIIKLFENNIKNEPHHFNQAMMVKVEGTAEEIEEVIKAIVSHHDMLRGVYVEKTLRILDNEEKRYEYEVLDYCEVSNEEEKIEQKCDEKQRSMNLEKGPLIKCVLFKVKRGNYLFICLHHLVVDGVSWRILIEDIQNILKQLKEGKEIKLPPKTVSFKEWSEDLIEYKESKKLKKEIEYWKKIEFEMIEGCYKGESQETEFGYETVSMELSEEETKKLLRECEMAYNTEINDLLLSALGMSIKELKGQEKVTIMLEGHGREDLHKSIKIDRTVGWFTSVFPVILECHNEVEESIIKTKEMLRKVPNHGIGYGLLSKTLEKGDISFNYLGEIKESRDIENIYKIGKSISEKNQKLVGNISLNGVVQGGKLMFEVSYDRSMYSSAEMHELTKIYQKKILEEILHCSEKEEVMKTPSDFTGNNITESVLNILDDIF